MFQRKKPAGRNEILIQSKLTDKANFNLRKYAINNGFTNKGEALNDLLENFENYALKKSRAKKKKAEVTA